MRRVAAGVAACALLLAAGCREADRPLAPGAEAIQVDSDPQGARVYANRRNTGEVTPTVLRGLGPGTHEIIAELDTAGAVYGFRSEINLLRDSVARVSGPLMLRCATAACRAATVRAHVAGAGGGMRISTLPNGLLFFRDGSGDGLRWPANSANSYVAVGAPVFAGRIPSVLNPVALGPYNATDPTAYLAGRPAQTTVVDGRRLELRQTAWILPPPMQLLRQTVRGIEIRQELIVSPELEGVTVVRIVYRNVTRDPLYLRADPLVPPEGITYEDTYIGFVVDADVGASDDDMVSYVADDHGAPFNMVFMYDSDFFEAAFEGGVADRPGLVGLRLLERPVGTQVTLTSWSRTQDWFAGTVSERDGWSVLRGQELPGLPVHEHPRLGHVPEHASDWRMAVSAGPLRLAPGDSATIRVALVLAPPVPGTFQSGTVLPPGSPTDPGRQVMRTAGTLIERARAAEGVR
jgi:hypothetical protein